jgi:ribosome-binding protein aMBF1 (putative translation factor)
LADSGPTGEFQLTSCFYEESAANSVHGVPREVPEKLILNVGRRVAEIRQQAGLSQEGLAEKLGLSVQYVSRVELGTNLTLTTLVKLANSLHVRAADLLLPAGPEMKVRRGRPRKIR